MNIALIGMPGSGKTTIGKALAKDMGLTALDSDREIERLHSGTLAEIIARVGQAEFRRIEEEVNAQLHLENTVISPGGSVIYDVPTMEHLQALGTVVYLDISFPTLQKRIGDPRVRGVAIPEGFTFRDLYDQRVPLYRQYAAVTVPQAENEPVSRTLEKLLAALDEP